MKRAKLGDYLLWDGQVVRVEWINEGHKAIGFTTKKRVQCPHCNELHEIDDSWNVIEHSPQFQENAKPLPTIKE